MISHYGTTPMIRQCVMPGMMALHEGRTYRVSAVIQERKGCTCTPMQRLSGSLTA